MKNNCSTKHECSTKHGPIPPSGYAQNLDTEYIVLQCYLLPAYGICPIFLQNVN